MISKPFQIILEVWNTSIYRPQIFWGSSIFHEFKTSTKRISVFLTTWKPEILDQNPSFLALDTLELFKTEKVFQIKVQLRRTTLFKILTKKIKKLFFCLFFEFFRKVFIFFRNFFFQFCLVKFIFFYFLKFLSDFNANTIKMSKICLTFSKN